MVDENDHPDTPESREPTVGDFRDLCRQLNLSALGYLCGVCLLLSGCSSDPHVGKKQAIAIARQEVISKGWKEFKVEGAVFEEGRWMVMIWELPAKPGGFVTLEISSSGKVIRLLPGY